MERNWRHIIRNVVVIVAIIAGLAAIGLYIVRHEWDLYTWICTGIFIVGIALYAALDPAAITRAFTGRQAKYGSNALILTIAFLGILVVVNALVYKNNKRWDLSEDKSNTLAKETIDILKGLPGTVTAKAFFTTSSSNASVKERTKSLLDQYAYESNGKFKYEFIDPTKDPVATTDAGITKDGTVVLYMGSSKQTAASLTEKDISSAIVRLLNPGANGVYFLTGHGEYPLDTSGDQSFTDLKSALEANNFTVASLNLIATNQIPADAKVIVVAGPQKPLTDGEVSLLSTFMKNGGAMVVMEDPPVVTKIGDVPDPLANYLSQTYGVILGNDIVVDKLGDQSMQQPFIAIGLPNTQQAITKDMGQAVTGFPTARSVTSNNTGSSDYTTTSIISTVSQSYAETDSASLNAGTYAYNEGVDMPGPISMGVAVQGNTSKTRLVVIGDADFALNVNYTFQGNEDLIVNSIDWAANSESIINLTPKTTVERTLAAPKAYTMGLILLGSLVVLPGIVLVTGVVTWVGRRRRG